MCDYVRLLLLALAARSIPVRYRSRIAACLASGQFFCSISVRSSSVVIFISSMRISVEIRQTEEWKLTMIALHELFERSGIFRVVNELPCIHNLRHKVKVVYLVVLRQWVSIQLQDILCPCEGIEQSLVRLVHA